MKKSRLVFLLAASLLLPVTASGEGPIYKSVDAAGNVTYSSEPPADAAKVEGIEIPAAPSEETLNQAVERAKDMEQEADVRYQALVERRRQEAEARKKAQEEAEAAERARRIQEAIEDSAAQPSYYVWPDWRWPRPPRPPHPPIPPRPPLR